MSDSDTSPKENILKIMDDFLSHLNRTKKLFMALIFASFIISPLSLVLAVFVLTPQFAMQAGQSYDMAVSVIGVPAQETEFGFIENLNESDVVFGNFTASHARIQAPFGAGVITPHGNGNFIIVRGDGMHQLGNETAVVLKNSAVRVQYVPLDAVQVEPFSIHTVPPPRFMYVGEAGQFGRQTDVTTLVMVVVAVSAALATTWLVIGVKEFKFFSKWNQRYSNYKKLQDKLDEELED
jgi:hypothetical protein